MAAALLRHLSFLQSWYQPLLKGWCEGHPGWDHLLSRSRSAQGWACPRVPLLPAGRKGTLSAWPAAQLSQHWGEDGLYLGRLSWC